jgi:hypothetical protein
VVEPSGVVELPVPGLEQALMRPIVAINATKESFDKIFFIM